MIEARHLIKDYKSKKGVNTRALNDISLKLPAKGMVFVLGKSGSGKSTLLNVLGGLDSIDSGEIIIKGRSTARFRQKHFDSYRNTYVGFIFQEYNILDNFTVGQNIALAMKLQNRKPTSKDINDILKQVDLAGLGDRRPNELSGGQKQRVAIARALIKNPKIIMADEPTGALDSTTGIQIFDTLKELSKDKLVLIVSHDREFSERYADRIIELKDGEIISDVEVSKKGDKVEQNIKYSGNEIVINKNYELTNKDLKIINDFIKKNKKDIHIKSENKNFGKSRFVDTKESNIVMDKTSFKLIKSKLPLSHAIKMGGNALKHKKFKLVMTIFLSLISFTMLGMAATFGLCDVVGVQIDAIRNSDINFANYQKNLLKKDEDNNRSYVTYYPFSNDDINAIKQEVNYNVIPVYDSYMSSTTSSIPYYSESTITILNSSFKNPPSSPSYQPDFLHYAHEFKGAVCLDGVDLNEFNIKIMYQDKGSRLPQESADPKIIEIAVPYFVAYTFVKYGYSDGTTKIDITSADQLLQKTIKLSFPTVPTPTPIPPGPQITVEYKIVGILDTGFNFLEGKYSNLLNYSYQKDYEMRVLPFGREFLSFINSSLANKIILSPNKINTFNNNVVRHVISPLQKNKIKQVCEFCSKNLNISDNDKKIYKDYLYAKYKLSDRFTSDIFDSYSNFDMMTLIFLYVGIAFIVFSGLLLANFITNSITYQRKEIGILRAIGAKSHDVFKIYMSESFIIAIINFILSTIASYCIIEFVIMPTMLKMLKDTIKLFSFGWTEILLILGVSLISAFLATYLPVRHIAKRKPIETIRLK